MDDLNCLKCDYKHKANGNCTAAAVGGFCIAVPAAYCRKLKEYMDTGLAPEDLKKAFDETAALKLSAQCLQTSPDRLRELAAADKDGRVVVLPDELEQDIRNPLEPLKVLSALSSEVRKYEYRAANKPEDISILDYTIIAALKDVLTRAEADNRIKLGYGTGKTFGIINQTAEDNV